MAELKRVIEINGVKRTLALDFNATIALADATGEDFFQVIQTLQDKDLSIGKKMRGMRLIIWAMSASEHPEFEGKPETVNDVGGWFDISDVPAIAECIGGMTGEYAQRVAKNNGGGREFEGQLAPFVPSPPAVVEAAINAADIKPGEIVFDLGAGDGRVMLRAAEAGATVVGWENHPERFEKLQARYKEHSLRDKMTATKQDLREAPIGTADVVFVYLLPSSNETIKDWLWQNCKAGARIVSHDFLFVGKESTKHLSLRDEEGKLHQIYVYQIPEVTPPGE